MTSLYNISEQIVSIIGSDKAEPQAIIQVCKNAYAQVCFKSWTFGKQDGVSEVGGQYLYTFAPIEPQLDITTDRYYIVLPSSYVNIVHDLGINSVSYTRGLDKPFVRMATGMTGLFAGLKSAVMGNHQTYEVEGNKMFFPKMTASNKSDLMLRLAIAFSEDVDEELNISGNDAAEIVAMVVDQYSKTPQVKPDTLIK